MKPLAAFFLLLTALTSPLHSDPVNAVANPSFEEGAQGWDSLWCREEGKGTATVVTDPAHQSSHALKVEYQGDRDWSFSQEAQLPVKPGEVYAFSGWVKIEQARGTGQGQLSVVTRDAQGQVMDWLWAMKNSTDNHDWRQIQGRFLIPPGCATIQFRITGEGPAITYWDGLTLAKVAEVSSTASLQPVTLTSAGMELAYLPSQNQILLSSDGGASYVFQGFGKSSTLLKLEKTAENEIDLQLADPYGSTLDASVVLDPQGTALFSLKGEGAMDGDFEFPGPLLSNSGENWVLPVNEGLYVPAADPYFKAWDLVLYGGHGLCMPFIGLTSGKEGLVAIAETQNDAEVRFTPPEKNGTSSWSFLWQPSHQAWGYERRLRVELTPKGGYVGIAKAYRDYARTQGLLLTLKDKAAANPSVDKLIGAVDLWWWRDGPTWQEDPQPGEAADEIKEAGIERVLWSHEQSPESVDRLNGLGFLTGRYDIYQDVYSPDTPLSWVNKEGWPDCLDLLPSGDWMKGWVSRMNGTDYTGGVLCSSCILDMAKRHIPDDLKTHAYHARFLDTTTASPMRECYSPQHPLTRTQDRANKMALLDYVSKEMALVTGSETGVDMAVPHLDYFEGMISLGPYRLADAGYDLFTVEKPQEDFLRFQVGPYYRIPLFELVYHGCVVDYGYWGDSSNRLPDYWDRRDLFNALYGTPPIWTMDPALWAQYKDRFIQSYKTATPVARQTGYSEMLSHSFVTADHTVQTSVFADGTRVWVNFGDKPYRLSNGEGLKPMGYKVYWPKKIALKN
jgi:hypothetical protein